MQALFLPGAPWGTPWMERVLPAIEELTVTHASRTVFTRFIPAQNAETARGAWTRYYRKWESITLDHLDPEQVDLAPSLRRFVPPAAIVDKSVYSPWTEGRLGAMLASSGVRAIVISGGETDVCVLAAVLGAVDRGFRVVIAADAVCGSTDETHDAAMTLYASRFTEQIEMASTEEILSQWR